MLNTRNDCLLQLESVFGKGNENDFHSICNFKVILQYAY